MYIVMKINFEKNWFLTRNKWVELIIMIGFVFRGL
jgi:hypothetical protein